jgi:hypothetical protein
MKELPKFYIDTYREEHKGDGKPEDVEITKIKKDFFKILK